MGIRPKNFHTKFCLNIQIDGCIIIKDDDILISKRLNYEAKYFDINNLKLFKLNFYNKKKLNISIYEYHGGCQ